MLFLYVSLSFSPTLNKTNNIQNQLYYLLPWGASSAPPFNINTIKIGNKYIQYFCKNDFSWSGLVSYCGICSSIGRFGIWIGFTEIIGLRLDFDDGDEEEQREWEMWNGWLNLSKWIHILDSCWHYSVTYLHTLLISSSQCSILPSAPVQLQPLFYTLLVNLHPFVYWNQTTDHQSWT